MKMHMKSYLRFLGRNKLYTAIKVVVMSISLAFVIIASCQAWKIVSLTWNIDDHEDIYALSGLTEHHSHPELHEHLDEIPEVIEYALYNYQQSLLKIDTELYNSSVAIVDDGFFIMFPIKVVSGINELALKKDCVLVSRSFAKSRFGNVNEAPGKTVELSADGAEFTRMTICGVFDGIEDSIFRDLDFITSWDSSSLRSSGVSMQTFVKVTPGCAQKDLSDKVHELIKVYLPDIEKQIVMYGLDHEFAVPLDDVYYSHSKNGLKNGYITDLIIILVIAFLLLVSAILNYMNMNFAQISKRSNEIATMRLVGADRSDILKRHIMESISLTGICILFAVLISVAAIPAINGILRYQDPISIPFTSDTVVIVLVIWLVVGFVAGLVPALLTTSFKPIDVAKGSFRKKRKVLLVKVFMFVQNALAACLIMVSQSVECGIWKMLDVSYGTGSEDLIFIDRNTYGGDKDDSVLINMLESCPFVDGQCGYSTGTLGMALQADGISLDGNAFSGWILVCDSTAFKVYDIEVTERYTDELLGSMWYSSNLLETIGADSENVSDLLPSDVFKGSRYKEAHSGGTIGNFMTLAPGYDFGTGYENGGIYISDNEYWNYIVMKTTGDRQQAFEAISSIVTEFSVSENGSAFTNPAVVYLDDIVEASVHESLTIRDFVRLFVLIAILISVLGMIAMSYYFAEENTMSIAVHKVFGGTVASETSRNIRTFMTVTILASLVGVPIGWYVTRTYLSDIIPTLGSGIPQMLGTVAFIILASLASVLWQTLRAARTNPAEALKKE